jgi:hypothetical protein
MYIDCIKARPYVSYVLKIVAAKEKMPRRQHFDVVVVVGGESGKS